MDTRRSSATGASPVAATSLPAGAGAAAGAAVAPATSGVAHSPQNFAVGALAAPHDGHMAASRVAHSPQNLRPASFSVPQLEQIKRARLPSDVGALSVQHASLRALGSD